MTLTERAWAFARALTAIGERSPLASGRPLDWIIIANPRAGGFMIRSRWKHHSETLKRLVEQTGAKARLPGAGPSPIAPPQGLILTTGPGQAEQAVSRLIAEWGALGGDTFHLIITAGGDGTSREALSAVYKAAESVRQRLGVLRLPLGTGNDGADAPALDKALEALLYPCEAALSRAVRLTTARGAEFYGFNILSLGLDAFVTHMTNKMKGFFPGDSYKLWVDMAALFYDTLYHVGEMQVEGFDEQGNRTGFLKEPLLLLAMGPSGRRSYGSGKRILPDERNVCALKQMPLFRKLALKGLFASGGHAGKAEAVLFHAHKLIIQGAAPILAQMDGETALLGPEDFPASLARTEPVIPTLQPRPLRGFL